MKDYPLHYFVLPNNPSLPSGGNIYNHFFINTLLKRGIVISIIDFEKFQLLDKSEHSIFWIDTLFLSNLQAYSFSYLNQYFLITHHLESLYPPKEYNSESYFNKYEKELLTTFHGFLTTSDFTTNYLKQRGFQNKKIITIPPALCLNPILSSPITDKVQAIMVSNLVERKGILPFLQALEKQSNHIGTFELTIIGTSKIEPTYATKCIDFLNKHPKLKQSITIIEGLPQTEVFKHYQNHNLFISTAFMETYGMALQEAVGFRLPILALDGGNVGYHIKEGQNGFLFQKIENLVDYFVKLTTEKRLIEQIVHSAKLFDQYENYTWDTAVDLFLEQLN